MLLAVPPDTEPWSMELLEEILLETVELVRLRTVDADALTGLGQFLPALLFATYTSERTATASIGFGGVVA